MHPEQMAKPPQLAALDVQEQRFYSQPPFGKTISALPSLVNKTPNSSKQLMSKEKL